MPNYVELTREEEVFVLRMKHGENRFNFDSITAINQALDEVEASTGAAALVTVGEGKFYSNGLDLDWMSSQDQETSRANIERVEKTFARVLAFPMFTVCAMNGHAFAAGAMLALCHDVRVMRNDRGYFCLPEIDIHMSFTPGMNALIQARMSKIAAHEATVTGKRFTADDALKRDIVHVALPEQEVLAHARALAKQNAGKPRHIMQAIKKDLYRETLKLLGTRA